VKNIVITGSTRGIGYGLADSFLHLGSAVAISGRTQEAVDEAVAELAAKHDAGRIWGRPCDVSDFEQVQALWGAAQARFGQIDVWINNAGIGHPQVSFWKLSPSQVEALEGMLGQGFGAIYNMEGLGSGGPKVAGTSVYAASKAGLSYFDEMLAQETRGTPILVGTLNPGMVITDLVTKPYDGRPEEWERAKRIFNIIADRVETVAPWLAQKILDNTQNGVSISRMSTWKVAGRFLASPFRKRDLFE
jgi:NAD(P)-dependent dehydrogenase (short-subunit alcohol dehydrogenase family)